MNPRALLPRLLLSASLLLPGWVSGQPHDEPDRAAPGDAMMQAYLRQATQKIEADFLGSIKSAEDWNRARPRFREEYFDMLGLWPVPEKTPLHAVVTGTLDRGDYLVEMLHYQSRPGLYVWKPVPSRRGPRWRATPGDSLCVRPFLTGT